MLLVVLGKVSLTYIVGYDLSHHVTGDEDLHHFQHKEVCCSITYDGHCPSLMLFLIYQPPYLTRSKRHWLRRILHICRLVLHGQHFQAALVFTYSEAL